MVVVGGGNSHVAMGPIHEIANGGKTMPLMMVAWAPVARLLPAHLPPAYLPICLPAHLPTYLCLPSPLEGRASRGAF